MKNSLVHHSKETSAAVFNESHYLREVIGLFMYVHYVVIEATLLYCTSVIEVVCRK